ncbi:hypothetical protein AOP6_0824 [Desulfuromonas sp. AOP6]|nr:hypothetical protein AOP6_0824 [Desulfuromonas sp. AOP6]
MGQISMPIDRSLLVSENRRVFTKKALEIRMFRVWCLITLLLYLLCGVGTRGGGTDESDHKKEKIIC